MFDADAILRTLTEIRNALPKGDERPEPGSAGDPDVVVRKLREVRRAVREGACQELGNPVRDFEYIAIQETVESLIPQLDAVLERAEARVLETWLRIYYAAEDLSRDPANAHLLAHVEDMRREYERVFGEPIPPKSDPERVG